MNIDDVQKYFLLFADDVVAFAHDSKTVSLC